MFGGYCQTNVHIDGECVNAVWLVRWQEGTEQSLLWGYREGRKIV